MKDEPALLRAARKLNQDALITIFDRYASAIYKYVLRFCHDPVESDRLVGEVFTELLGKFSGGQGPQKNLRLFLYQIAYPLVKSRINPTEHCSQSEVIIGLPTGASVHTPLEDPVFIEALLAALQGDLSEDQRHVIILRFLEDFSLHETAAILGKDPEDVRLIEKRGITELRKCLGL
ncbi:MAG TPA: sigma-70 family RNA polymerase sigma factor [Anaerolineales bacterium]|nr:sigma-70 family RNA polymerase sigma factor [Anaerolineales bacterium]